MWYSRKMESLKTCPRCKEPQSVDCFSKSKANKDGLQAYCRTCHRETVRAAYQKNPERTKSQAVAWKKDKRTWILSKKDQPCTDCGRKYPPEVMDFDHMEEHEKSASISEMYRRNFSRKKIEEEMSKCEIVCANCHRLRTKARSEGLPYNAYVGGDF